MGRHLLLPVGAGHVHHLCQASLLAPMLLLLTLMLLLLPDKTQPLLQWSGSQLQKHQVHCRPARPPPSPPRQRCARPHTTRCHVPGALLLLQLPALA